DRLLDTYAPVAHISTIRLLIAMASIHNMIIHQMDVKTAFLNGDLDDEVDLTKEFLSSNFSLKDMGQVDVILGKLSRYNSNPDTQHWQAIQRAFKTQNCIIGSTMKSEFVALAAAGKEAEWMKNLLFEILLWSKHITSISICYDSGATLAKAYSQMYNGKSRHLDVRHSMIHELITNEVVSIEFVRSQQNLVDHLTKGLARDLVIKSAEWMRLKSN
nr:zinc finger, CCHC-type [Tanacetum cinerariifolium]